MRTATLVASPALRKYCDDTTQGMVLSAGGSGTDLSSVWFIRTGDEKHVHLIWGAEGELHIGQTIIAPMYDSGTGGFYDAYCTSIGAWVGMATPSFYDLGRLANVSDDGGSYTLTDKLLNQCVQELFPAGRKPNLIAMSRRSLCQLQNSRTPIMFMGNTTTSFNMVAPIPTEAAGGIPIIVSDAISNGESTLGVTA